MGQRRWYEEASALLIGRSSGITIQELCAAIFERRCALPMYVPLEGFSSASGISNAMTLTREYVSKRISTGSENRSAIFQVKTRSGTLHFIYYSGVKIFDPSPDSPENPEFTDYDCLVDGIFLFDLYH